MCEIMVFDYDILLKTKRLNMKQSSVLFRTRAIGKIAALSALCFGFLSTLTFAGDAAADARVEAMIKGADAAKLPAAADTKVDFAKDIKPIFKKSCMDCHDADGAMGKFRVDKKETAMKGGESGPAIVAGKSAKSPIVFYVAGLIKDKQMPPKDQGEPLTREQIGLLRAWIDQGAKWE
jgi:mono/diheme cytochrome c family protein